MLSLTFALQSAISSRVYLYCFLTGLRFDGGEGAEPPNVVVLDAVSPAQLV